jgi:hypothetical protein
MAEQSLRQLAALAHGEVLTGVMSAWEQRQPEQLPSAQALGSRLSPAARTAWVQALGGAPGAQAKVALLRLEMAAEVPTPAEHLSDRRQLQLLLLTRRNDATPGQTWVQDVAQVLAGSHDSASARRLQVALKVLLRR